MGAKCGHGKREGNVTVGTCIIDTICVCNSCLAWKKLAGKWIPSTPKSRQIWLSMDWMGLKPKPPSKTDLQNPRHLAGDRSSLAQDPHLSIFEILRAATHVMIQQSCRLPRACKSNK